VLSYDTRLLDCVGNEISKDDVKYAEKERNQQANTDSDTRTASRVSLN